MSTLKSGKQIVERAGCAKQEFGDSCPKKYGSAATIEILRDALHEEGIEGICNKVVTFYTPIDILSSLS
jgi:hypothetical protein